MLSKKNILVLCGGQSTEHEISILSARNVIEQLESEKYVVTVGYILRDGRWFYFKSADAFLTQNLSSLFDSKSCVQMCFIPGEKNALQLVDNTTLNHIDCVVPVLHGANGEDGVMQGFLSVMDVPCVGPDVLGASVAMHKDVTKHLLQQANLPVVDWLLLTKEDKQSVNYDAIVKTLGSPFFVKGNSLGSSIGVHKVNDETQFALALADAFQYDERVLLEKTIVGREIECSVLGNEKPVASLPGEIINHTEFYSYAAKYLEEDAATVQTPADLPEAVIANVRQLAVKAFKAVYCEGMARVDFFVTSDESIYINEINTIPGFTDISMYPKNWEATGLSQPDLFDKLIQLAIARFERRKLLVRDFVNAAAYMADAKESVIEK